MLRKLLIPAIFLILILFQIDRFIPLNNVFTWSFLQKSSSHPIPHLMARARIQYETLLSRQSSSLGKAVREYQRRYNRKPPKGFDEWYSFAKENNVKIIDEYDQLMEDLRPFFDLSGEEMRRRALQVSLCLFAVRITTNSLLLR